MEKLVESIMFDGRFQVARPETPQEKHPGFDPLPSRNYPFLEPRGSRPTKTRRRHPLQPRGIDGLIRFQELTDGTFNSFSSFMNIHTSSFSPVELGQDRSCDHEALHLIGQIQAGKALVAIELATPRFTHGSEGTEHITGRAFEKDPTQWISSHRIAGLLRRSMSWRGRGPMPCVVEPLTGAPLQCWVYISGSRLVLEWDTDHSLPSMAEEWDLEVREGLEVIESTTELNGKMEKTVEQIRSLTGFDRVMIYRFLPDGAGEVVAEAMREDWEPYRGLRYPAGDIPKPARDLFLINDLRLIASVDDAPLKIRGIDSLDLSLSRYRQPAPVHIEYLQNMEVGASLVTAIRIDGKLWGLISCHHGTPRPLTMRDQSRVAALTSHLSVDISGAAREQRLRDELACARLANKLVQCVTLTTEWAPVMISIAPEILQTMRADAMALHIDGKTYVAGGDLSADEASSFIDQFGEARRNQIDASDCLKDHLGDSSTISGFAGMLWISLSAFRDDCLLLFRKEQRHSVTWAGDPDKSVTFKRDGSPSPRQSFAAWVEEVVGKSEPWAEAEIHMAETVRSTLIDIVITSQDYREMVETPAARRFRAAHHEIGLPLVFADLEGRVVYQNRAAKADPLSGIGSLDELLLWETDQPDFQAKLSNLHSTDEELNFASRGRDFELARLSDEGEFVGYSLKVLTPSPAQV